MAQVKATGNINHDGTEFEAGDVLQVTNAQGDALVEAGVAEFISRDDEDESEDVQPEEEVSRREVLMAYSRKELNEFAKSEFDLDTSDKKDFKNKTVVVDAILAKEEAEEESEEQ